MATLKVAVLILLAALATVAAAEEPDQLIDILPPNWYPGDVLGSTEHSKIEKALKDVDRSASILDTRTIGIGVASLAGRLFNPRYHLVDGQAHANMPYNITAGKTGLLLFTKTQLAIVGIYGVVTYDIADTPLKVAIMFSVPYNTLTYDHMFHFRVFSRSTPVNKALVQQMYKCSGAWSAKGYEEKTEYGVHMRGTMTDNTHSRLIVWVDVSNADVTKGPTLNAVCDSKGVIIGKNRCRRECAPTGHCWTKQSCKSDADCASVSLTCSGSCDKC